jgi:hypothetical protein
VISKAAAMERARKLPGPPKPGVVILRGEPIEVAIAWMELHGMDPAKNIAGRPRWEMGVLVVKRGIEPAPTPPLPPPQVFDLERGLDEGE